MSFNEIAQILSEAKGPLEVHFHDVHDNKIEHYHAGQSDAFIAKVNDTKTTVTEQVFVKLSKEQKSLFDHAISAGLMSQLPDGRYQWLSSKALLSYFCGRVFCGDRPMEGCDGRIVWEFGGGTFPTSAVERMFGVKSRDTYRRHRNMLSVPQEHDLVDNLWL